MMFATPCEPYEVNPVIERALEGEGVGEGADGERPRFGGWIGAADAKRGGRGGDQRDGEIQPHKADNQRQHRQDQEHPGRNSQPSRRLAACSQPEIALRGRSREREESQQVAEFGDQVVGSFV